jgi:hypothetical protein
MNNVGSDFSKGDKNKIPFCEARVRNSQVLTPYDRIFCDQDIDVDDPRAVTNGRLSPHFLFDGLDLDEKFPWCEIGLGFDDLV